MNILDSPKHRQLFWTAENAEFNEKHFPLSDMGPQWLTPAPQHS
ncbi:hypothetical protein [Saccharopolyspora spinosa]